jgi:polyphosphate glucokinase
MKEHDILGIDVGASGIKGAIVDVRTGALQAERLRLDTPQPSTPSAMAETFAELVRLHNWQGPVGCGFPTIVKNEVAMTASNIDKGWVGRHVGEIFSEASGCPVRVLNDADAAGIAEMQYGVGKGKKGTVLIITIGSGLGSALFINGQLAPNTEFGHVFLHNQIAEHYTANAVRKRLEMPWDEWGLRLNEYLLHMERLLSPDLIILGGGASKRFDRFEDFITLRTPVVPAQMLNDAGIAGAAYYAFQEISKEKVNK